MPTLNGVIETALYVDDLDRSVAFFERVLGLAVMERGKRVTAMDAGPSVLLLFLRGASVADMSSTEGMVPGHDGAGPLHMAFAIDAATYDEWRAHLVAQDVPIRSEVRWERGGRSLYFDDPDGHVLELATPGLWPNY